jgi:hypothetical protein
MHRRCACSGALDRVTQRAAAVDNNSFVPKKRPFVGWSYGAHSAHGIIGSITVSQHMMKNNRVLKSVPLAKPSDTLTFHLTRLTGEQFECLSRCAKGISLRFDASEIVDAVIAGGYAEKGVAGVVTVTIKGQHYLRLHGR